MTEIITDLIKRDLPFIYAKFGDGEYNAANGYYGSNCDGDPYTDKLRNGLIEAINYYSSFDNVYCGKWHTPDVPSYFDSMVHTKDIKYNWIDYHTCIMFENSFDNNNKLDLFKAIKESKRKKILVGNELLEKAKYLLNIENHILVPYRNWVEDLESILKNIMDVLNYEENPMIITCAGMGSKVLIMELHKRIKNGIFIDIGSGLDYLCTKKCSRGHTYSYDKLETYFKEILPPNWNDPNFNIIYEKAKHNIGIHLR
jgi:hypothetical protein